MLSSTLWGWRHSSFQALGILVAQGCQPSPSDDVDASKATTALGRVGEAASIQWLVDVGHQAPNSLPQSETTLNPQLPVGMVQDLGCNWITVHRVSCVHSLNNVDPRNSSGRNLRSSVCFSGNQVSTAYKLKQHDINSQGYWVGIVNTGTGSDTKHWWWRTLILDLVCVLDKIMISPKMSMWWSLKPENMLPSMSKGLWRCDYHRDLQIGKLYWIIHTSPI